MARIKINEFNEEFPSLAGKELTRENIKLNCFDKKEMVKMLLEIKQTIERGFKTHTPLTAMIKVKKLIETELEDIK